MLVQRERIAQQGVLACRELPGFHLNDEWTTSDGIINTTLSWMLSYLASSSDGTDRQVDITLTEKSSTVTPRSDNNDNIKTPHVRQIRTIDEEVFGLSQHYPLKLIYYANHVIQRPWPKYCNLFQTKKSSQYI